MAASASSFVAEVEQELDLSRPVIDMDPPGPDASAAKEPDSDSESAPGPIGGWEEDPLGGRPTADLPPACEMCLNCFDRHYAEWARNPKAEDASPTPTKEPVLAAAAATTEPGSAEQTVLAAAAARSEPGSAEETASESRRAGAAKVVAHKVSALDTVQHC